MGLRSLYRESTSKNTWTHYLYTEDTVTVRGWPRMDRAASWEWSAQWKSIQLTERDKPSGQGVMEESETKCFQMTYPNVSWPLVEKLQRISASLVTNSNTEFSAGIRVVTQTLAVTDQGWTVTIHHHTDTILWPFLWEITSMWCSLESGASDLLWFKVWWL